VATQTTNGAADQTMTYVRVSVPLDLPQSLRVTSSSGPRSLAIYICVHRGHVERRAAVDDKPSMMFRSVDVPAPAIYRYGGGRYSLLVSARPAVRKEASRDLFDEHARPTPPVPVV